MATHTALDRFGRVVIPKRSRERFGLEPGATLTVVETEAGILLKVGQESGPVRQKKGVLVYSGEATDGLERATFAVLSSYPVRARISPALAARLVRENVAKAADVIALDGADYAGAIGALADLSLGGGAIYDALIAQAAQKAAVDRLLTLNPRDFLRVWPGGTQTVALP